MHIHKNHNKHNSFSRNFPCAFHAKWANLILYSHQSLKTVILEDLEQMHCFISIHFPVLVEFHLLIYVCHKRNANVNRLFIHMKTIISNLTLYYPVVCNPGIKQTKPLFGGGAFGNQFTSLVTIRTIRLMNVIV